MQYFVKRGYSYVNPNTLRVTTAGQPVTDEEIDERQKWKLQVTEVKPVETDSKVVKKKQSYDEAEALVIAERDKKTAARREARSEEQRKVIEEAQRVAAKVKSDSVKKPKPILPEDYDEMDEGEETE
jgi:hypothetical protein